MFVESEDEVMVALQFTNDTLDAIDVTAVTEGDLEDTAKAVTDLTASNIWLNNNSPEAAQALFDNYPLSITFMVDLKNDAGDKEEEAVEEREPDDGNGGGDGDSGDDDTTLLISTIVLAVVAALLLLALAAMFIMSRRGAAAKGRARPARQTQPAPVPAPQLVVEETKPQVRDPYGVVRRSSGANQNNQRRASLAQMRGDTEPSAPRHDERYSDYIRSGPRSPDARAQAPQMYADRRESSDRRGSGMPDVYSPDRRGSQQQSGLRNYDYYERRGSALDRHNLGGDRFIRRGSNAPNDDGSDRRGSNYQYVADRHSQNRASLY